MSSFIDNLRRVYRRSTKPEDIAWNTYVARPLAAVLVVLLRPTPLTPNQVTFLGMGVFTLASISLVLWPGPTGFLVAVALIQFAYLFDCADGQLARIKDQTSGVGAYLDFLMDEIKALVLVGAVSVRLWYYDGDELWSVGELWPGDELWLLVGIAGMFVVATATSLTNFIRRPEYAGEQIDPGDSARKTPIPESAVGKIVWMLRAGARYIVHYPSWVVWAAIAGYFVPFDTGLLFLVPYLGIYLLYLAQTSLAVVWRLGRSGFYD